MEPEPSSPLTPIPAPTLPVNLYVANLPLTWSEDTFRDRFISFGPIESAKILTDSSLKRSRGVGFLQFAEHQHALAAIAAMDGHVVTEQTDGSPQSQQAQQPQQQQQEQQQEQPVKALIVKFAAPRAANPNGAATPKASTNKAATHTPSPRTPRKHLTIPSSPTASSASSTTSSTLSTTSSSSSADHNLYVAGFPLSYSREDVSRLLSPFGPLASLRLLPPSPGGSASERKSERRGGVAFARFVCIEDGDRCIAAMDGQPIEGGNRGLQVRYANRGGRLNAQQASMGLDGSAMSAVDYSAYSSFYGLSSPYAASSFEYSNQLLLSPSYGYTAATDLLSPSYASYPYTVVDPYTGGSYYFAGNSAASPMAAAPSVPVGLTSPTAFTAFSFPSPTTASVAYPTTPSHSAAAATTSAAATSSPSVGNLTANSSLFPAHLSLFLCHLPLHWSEANLLSLCNPFGHLTSARIVRDRDGGSRGYGFVAFDQSDDAARAKDALDGRKVDGRLVKVQWKDGRLSRTISNNGSVAGGDGVGVEGAVYGGLMSPTAGGRMGLAVMA